ncbi:MAG: hypothetical protein H6923_06515 [Alphaproteobacteria bacterium]|nr:hypothetical protein [Alphaproteobacteria bacterium]
MSELHPYLKGMDAAERVAFALAYPFAPPSASWALVDGKARPFDAAAARAAAEPARTAVIAYGSNASPQHIARKYGGRPGIVPTVRGRLEGFAIVHSAKFTAYGAMPATLTRAEGAWADIFVNFLDAEQLERMHATEALGVEYVFTPLPKVALTLEAGLRPESVHTYASLAGAFAPEGEPIALDAVPQSGPFAATRHAEAQEQARTRLGVEATLPAFIDENIREPAVRARRIAALKAWARPVEV